MSDESNIAVESGPADAIRTVTEYDGPAIRQCKGPRATLEWQAGVLTTEHRSYQDNGMFTPFRGTVSLFRLLGYGTCREDAVRMARQNGSK